MEQNREEEKELPAPDKDQEIDILPEPKPKEASEEEITKEIAMGEEIRKLEAELKRETEKQITPPPLPVDSGDDPIRLYLKEIGLVDLLDVDHEFWLATRVEAIKRFERIRNQHPISKRGDRSLKATYRALYDELSTHWKHILEDTQDLNFNLPDFLSILEEAQQLQDTWDLRRRSYLR